MRDLKNESQTLQAEQNRLSKEIGARPRRPASASEAAASSSALKEKIEGWPAELAAAEAKLDELLLELPNLPHPSVPVGKDETREQGPARGGARSGRYDFAAQAALGPRHRARTSSTSSAA